MTKIALELGAESRDLDALQYHPNGGAWPETMQGYSIPETTRAYGAVLLNADEEEFTDSLGPRDVVAQAIVDEVAKGKGVETPDGRPAVWLDTTRISAHDAELSLPYMLRRYRAGGIDPLAEKILTYPVLHYQNGGLVIDRDVEDDARRPLRLRRDRRRHARTQSHDGQLTLGMRRLRKESRCRSCWTLICKRAVEDAAAHLYVWALKDIPQDLRDALKAAAGRETSVPGQRVLNTILKNVEVADGENNLVCQDTGIAVYTCRVGEHFPLHPARIYEALRDGTARATLEHPLRSNAVHTITRENTGPNIGYRLPIVHWEFIQDWDGLDVKCVPKGSGSENMSFLKMCVPADGVNGHQEVRARVDRRRRRQAVPARDRRRRHRRLRRLRDVPREGGDRAADRHAQQRPDRGASSRTSCMGLLNETGIGPMGLGGDVTVLNCHIEHADTHMTLNPVAVNYQCWAARRASAHIAADGTVDYDREA